MKSKPITNPEYYGSSNYLVDIVNIISSLPDNPNLDKKYNNENGFIIKDSSLDALFFLTLNPTYINCLITDF